MRHRHEMRFPTAARSDEEQVMLVARQHALFTPTDDSAQQRMALNEDPFPRLGIGVAGRVRRDKPVVDHPLSPSAKIHHFRINGNRNRYLPSSSRVK